MNDNPECVNFARHPIPAGYRLATSRDRVPGQFIPETWMFFANGPLIGWLGMPRNARHDHHTVGFTFLVPDEGTYNPAGVPTSEVPTGWRFPTAVEVRDGIVSSGGEVRAWRVLSEQWTEPWVPTRIGALGSVVTFVVPDDSGAVAPAGEWTRVWFTVLGVLAFFVSSLF